MAIIHGQAPQPQATPVVSRIVVKLREGVAAAVAGSDEAGALRRAAPELRFRSYLTDADRLLASRSAMFERYLVVEAPDPGAAQALARRLHDLPEVEEAYVEGGPTPPPAVSPDDDPRSANQGYLAAAPAGIDARWAWSVTDGDGIGFVDVEQGWTLNHEDLAGANITLLSGVNQAYPGHGTAVLGEVLAVDNTRGDIGIAPRASGRVVSQYRTSTTYSTAAAILSAAGSMRAGDVMLLEAQTTVAGSTFLPVEAETAVFDAISHAVGLGIVVVEAGGNGSNDLDAWRDAGGKARLDRNSSDFRDSGAILVGAGGAAAPHGRLGFSNFGSRIDCYAWGESIDTTGDGWTGNATNTYTTGFGGTSGATPIIAGAALLLQSWRKRRGHAPYSPDDVRSLLSDPGTGTASADPAADRIGVMPDLRALIERLAAAEDPLRVVNDRFLATVFILFGLIDDSPGVIWVPGKGPVPVNPGWGSRVQPATGALRDALAALAVSEVAGRMEHAGSRAALAAAAATALRVAADQIGQRG
jgi:hypothetical protein